MTRRSRFFALALVLTLVVGAIVLLERYSSTKTTPLKVDDKALGALQRIASPDKGPVAPEFQGISNWINSSPLTMAALKGKVVLVDFWTYTCVNCIRTFPYLKQWHEKYADKGLVIIGVHSPEFQFEKKTENVVRAVQEHGLKYAIAQDNDHATWDAFKNRAWPSKYLIDKEGVIRFKHAGEGAYDETERQIQALLSELGSDVSRVALNPDPGPAADPKAYASQGTGLTRELYAGWERNFAPFPYGEYVAHEEYYNSPDSTVQYKDPGKHDNHYIYLQGLWTNKKEHLQHARTTQELEDYIAIMFYAKSVNAVMDLPDNQSYKVLITMDGEYLTAKNKGRDISIDSDGKSFVLVDTPRMYHLVFIPEFGGHELKLSSNSDQFSLFAFTFGAYGAGP